MLQIHAHQPGALHITVKLEVNQLRDGADSLAEIQLRL
jgi:hypothetical protein